MGLDEIWSDGIGSNLVFDTFSVPNLRSSRFGVSPVLLESCWLESCQNLGRNPNASVSETSSIKFLQVWLGLLLKSWRKMLNSLKHKVWGYVFGVLPPKQQEQVEVSGVTWLRCCNELVAQLGPCCCGWVCSGPVPGWKRRSWGCVSLSMLLISCMHAPCWYCAVSFFLVSLLSFFIGFLKFSKEDWKALIANKIKPFTTIVKKMILISQTMWCWGFDVLVFGEGECLLLIFFIIIS